MKADDFMPKKLKITVLKKLNTTDIFGDNPPLGETVEACHQFEVGQEFIVGEDGNMPESFCHWAWNDVYKALVTLAFGGHFSGKASIVRCCTDGLRPVIFEIRRIE